MHAADEDGVGPGQLLLSGRPDGFIDYPYLPSLRQIGGDHENALRRHKGAHPIHQRIGVLERAEGWRIARKDTENAPAMAYPNLALHDLALEYSGAMVRDRIPRRFEVVGRVELGSVSAPGGLLITRFVTRNFSAGTRKMT